jgi:hypothetical protein
MSEREEIARIFDNLVPDNQKTLLSQARLALAAEKAAKKEFDKNRPAPGKKSRKTA